MKIIDPHLHLFDLSQGEYQWLKPENPPFWPDKAKIHQNFTEGDLQLTKPYTLAGFVHIEAGFDNEQPWRELQWLEQNCQQAFRSVAYIDITNSPINFALELSKLTQFSTVVGVRYIFDEDNIINELNSEQLLTNLQKLAEHQLIFELQISFDHIEAVNLVCQLLTRLPNLTIIINHAGFPEQDNQFEQWQSAIKKFSLFEHCALKCSGWEMVNRDYSVQWQQKVVSHCLACFGEDRVMLASNFPLTLFSVDYQGYWQNYIENLKLTSKQREKVCFENSYRWYQFDTVFDN
ncbi:MAG: amidohydrolase family protein [Thalassotalea sp.]